MLAKSGAEIDGLNKQSGKLRVRARRRDRGGREGARGAGGALEARIKKAAAEIDGLTKQSQKLRAERDAALTEQKQARAAAGSLEARVKKAAAEIDALHKQSKSLAAKRDEAQKQVRALEACADKVPDLARSVASLQAENAQLREAGDAAKRRADELEGDNAKLRAAIDDALRPPPPPPRGAESPTRTLAEVDLRADGPRAVVDVVRGQLGVGLRRAPVAAAGARGAEKRRRAREEVHVVARQGDRRQARRLGQGDDPRQESRVDAQALDAAQRRNPEILHRALEAEGRDAGRFAAGGGGGGHYHVLSADGVAAAAEDRRPGQRRRRSRWTAVPCGEEVAHRRARARENALRANRPATQRTRLPRGHDPRFTSDIITTPFLAPRRFFAGAGAGASGFASARSSVEAVL